MWLKTKIGKRVKITSTKESVEWEGTLVDIDAIGLTINDVEACVTFIPFNNVFAVRVLEL